MFESMEKMMTVEIIREATDAIAHLATHTLSGDGITYSACHPTEPTIIVLRRDRVEWLAIPTLEITASAEIPFEISRFAVGPCGTAVVQGERQIVLLRNGETVGRFNPNMERVHALVVSDRDEQIACANHERLSLYSFEGELLWTIDPNEEVEGWGYQLCWVGDGKVVSAQGAMFAIWENDNVDFVPHSNKYRFGKFVQSPDGERFARLTGTPAVAVFDGATCEEIGSRKKTLGFGAFRDETLVQWNERTLERWQYGTKKRVKTDEIPNESRVFDISHDGEWFWSKSVFGMFRLFPRDLDVPPASPDYRHAYISQDGESYVLTHEPERSCTVPTLVQTRTGESIGFDPIEHTVPHVATFLPNGNFLFQFHSMDPEVDNIFLLKPDGSTEARRGSIRYSNGIDTLLQTPPGFLNKDGRYEVWDFDLNVVSTESIDGMVLAPLNAIYLQCQEKNYGATFIYNRLTDTRHDTFDRARSCNLVGKYATWLDGQKEFWWNIEKGELIGERDRHNYDPRISTKYDAVFTVDKEGNGTIWRTDNTHEAFAKFQGNAAFYLSDDEEYVLHNINGSPITIFSAKTLTETARISSPFRQRFAICSNGILILINEGGIAQAYKLPS